MINPSLLNKVINVKQPIDLHGLTPGQAAIPDIDKTKVGRNSCKEAWE